MTQEDAQQTARRIRERYPLDAMAESDGLRFTRVDGRSMKARCPLPGHNDSNASFHVYTDEQRYHCFGACVQPDGDVIGYVQLTRGLGSFREAVQWIEGDNAPMASVPRKLVTSRPAYERTADELAALAFAARFYAARLRDAPPALGYLESRGINARQAHILGVGFAMGGLVTAAEREGLPMEGFASAGLVRDGHHEQFRGRVIIPDVSRAGDASWLTGRALARSKVEHPYRNVRGPKPLFGLRRLPADTSAVVVVEGPFDWLAMVCAGLPAVATLGAAPRGMATRLGQYQRVYLAFDADDAGSQYGAGFEAVLGERALRVALPEGCDPAGIAARRDGLAELRRAVVAAARSRPGAQPTA